MLSNSAVIGMVGDIIPMKCLSSRSRPNTESDGIVDLREAGTLFVFVTNLCFTLIIL